MKKIITTILLILLVGCQKVTVLEINTLRTSSAEITHRITYVHEDFGTVEIEYADFYSSFGVDNFLNEVCDYDLSGWERVQ